MLGKVYFPHYVFWYRKLKKCGTPLKILTQDKRSMMERRLEVIKRQAETILKLENKLASAQKDALEIELELEQKKSMAMTGGQENQSEFFPIFVRIQHLLSPLAADTQPVEAFRGTVHFLRMENSYLKGQDLLTRNQITSTSCPTHHAYTNTGAFSSASSQTEASMSFQFLNLSSES